MLLHKSYDCLKGMMIAENLAEFDKNLKLSRYTSKATKSIEETTNISDEQS